MLSAKVYPLQLTHYGIYLGVSHIHILYLVLKDI